MVPRMLEFDVQEVVPVAGQVENAGEALADIDVAGPFADVSDALVGSQVAQSCLWVSTRLGAAVQVYAEGLGVLATNVRETSADFADTDGGVAGRMCRDTPR